MKKYILFILYIIPLLTIGQRVVILSVHQLPEFGFSISRQDTTIIKGNSVVLGTNVVIFGGSGEYSYKWTPATTLSDSVVLHPVASPGDTTFYMLTVTDKKGCSFSIKYTVNVKKSLTDLNLAISKHSFDAVLFPNPNDGKFKVQISGPYTEKIELALYDNNGRLIKKQTIKNFTGNYTESFQSRLVSGAYSLQINAGRETLSRRFIIQ
jgi:Secretion system C-terminal sorting domain